MTVIDGDTIPTDSSDILQEAISIAGAIEVGVVGFGAASGVGRIRQENEDAYGVNDNWFAVADGMGGRDAGYLAAITAVTEFLHVAPICRVEELAATIAVVSEAVSRKAVDEGFGFVGTTLVGIGFSGRVAHVVNVGDSRVYLLRQDELRQVTQDHSVGAELAAAGVDTEVLGDIASELSALTSFVGDKDIEPSVQLVEVSLRDGDRFLLCTDGVYRDVGPMSMKVALEMHSPAAASNTLVQLADSAGGRDNATALVIDVGNPNLGDEVG